MNNEIKECFKDINNNLNIIIIDPYNKNKFDENEKKSKSKSKSKKNKNKGQNEKKDYSKEIIENYKELYSKEIGIFKDAKDFKENLEKKISLNIINILEGKKKIKVRKDERPLQMAIRYKPFILEYVLNLINNELENKIYYEIGKEKINKQVNSGFNLKLLSLPIYNILSNDFDEKNKDNYNIIKKIIDEYNIYKDETTIIQLLCLTYEDCLNKVLKKDNDERFKDCLKTFIKNVYDKRKGNEEDKKEYIAGLILLSHNLREFYSIYPKKSSRGKSNLEKRSSFKTKISFKTTKF